jgi:hypothetical protein
MRLSLGRGAAVGIGMIAGAAFLAGCGGSTVGNSSTAHIRSIDAATGAGTADILINGAATYGDQTYFTSDNNTPASPYQYIGPQNGVSLTYNLPNKTLPDSATPLTNTGNVSTGNYYTTVLLGTLSANYSGTPADPRVLQTILLPSRSGGASGVATVRIVDAAPDAGFNAITYAAGSVDVIIGTAPAANTFSSVAYATSSSYQAVTPGSSLPVTVTLVGAASGTPPLATGTINLSAGQVYTLFVAEPTTTPTYEVQLVTD